LDKGLLKKKGKFATIVTGDALAKITSNKEFLKKVFHQYNHYYFS